jgi:hypothetical protein
LVTVEIATDENKLIVPLCILPGPIWTAIEEHVNTLKDESVGLSLETQDTLHAKDIRALRL